MRVEQTVDSFLPHLFTGFQATGYLGNCLIFSRKVYRERKMFLSDHIIDIRDEPSLTAYFSSSWKDTSLKF